MRTTAVFDWDGTMRRGWTLEDWLKSVWVHRPDEVSSALIEELDLSKDLYAERRIVHDELVQRGEDLYLRSLEGLDAAEFQRLEFCAAAVAEPSVRPFAAHLISGIAARGVRCEVITGAPQGIVRHLCRDLAIGGVTGLQALNSDRGWRVVANPGLSSGKEKVMAQIGAGRRVVAAFGDSESDWPLWRAAEVPVLVSEAPPDAEKDRRFWLQPDGTGYEAVQSALDGILG